MADISHFMIPADDVDRAKAFYSALLNWKIELPAQTMDDGGIAAMQYHDIRAGKPRPGALNSGGLYKRHLNEPILNFVEVDDLDGALAKVESLGGKITMPAIDIPGVGRTAMILDSEGNGIGLWKPLRK
jgi:uncharacterized protein